MPLLIVASACCYKMWKQVNAALYYAKNLPQVKEIVERLKRFGIFVTLAKVSLQTNSLATQLLKIKDQYECLVKAYASVEMIKSANYTFTEAVQAISKNLTSENTLVVLNVTLKKKRKATTFLKYL